MNVVMTRLKQGLERLRGNQAYVADPVFHVTDPRPVAEFAKSLLCIGEKYEAERHFDWLVSVQNKNGSWNEVLNEEFSEESCVATPIIGRMLLIAYQELKKQSYFDAALKAVAYIRKKEFLPGYFIKSYAHYSDVLNVNATCAAFAQKAYEIMKMEDVLELRDRAIFNVVRYQFKDGAYPYASRLNTFPYEHHLNVRDPHYHALTLYFLLLADPTLSNRYFAISYKKAIKWLEKEFKKGKIDWSHCEHMFAVGVTGAYGYALFCSEFARNKIMSEKILAHLAELQRADGLFNRYEKSSMFGMIKGIAREIFEMEKVCPKHFSLATRLFRCKQRLGRDLRDRRNLRVSLYYSAQILDCLTEAIYSKL